MPDGTSVGNVYLDLVVRDTLTKQLQTMAQQAQAAMQKRFEDMGKAAGDAMQRTVNASTQAVTATVSGTFSKSVALMQAKLKNLQKTLDDNTIRLEQMIEETRRGFAGSPWINEATEAALNANRAYQSLQHQQEKIETQMEYLREKLAIESQAAAAKQLAAEKAAYAKTAIAAEAAAKRQQDAARQAHATAAPPTTGRHIHTENAVRSTFPAMAEAAQAAAGNTQRSWATVLSNVSGGFKGLMSSVLSVSKKIGSAFLNLAKNILPFNTQVKKAGGGVQSLAVRLRSIVSGALIFNVISTALSRMVSTMGTALTGTAQMQAALSNLKGAAATAAAPIIQILTPALSALANAAATVFSYLAQLISFFTGKSVSAMASAAKGMAGVGSAAAGTAKQVKEATRSVAGFDELEKLSAPQDNSDSGGGGSGTSAPALNYDFQGKSPFLDSVLDAIQGGDWFQVGRLIGEKLRNSLNTIPWPDIQAKAVQWATNIAATINGAVTTPGLWEAIGHTLAQGLNTVTAFADTFFQGVWWADIGAGLARGLMQLVSEVNWEQLGRVLTDGLRAALLTLHGFVTTYTGWADLGTSIAAMIGAALTNIDWVQAAGDLSRLAIGLLTTLNTALSQIDWSTVGQTILGMLMAIDWAGLFGQLAQLFANTWPLLLTAVVIPAILSWIGGTLLSALNKALVDMLAAFLAKTVLTTIVSGIGSILSSIVAAIGGWPVVLIAAIVVVFGLLLKAIIDNWDAICDWFSGAWDSFVAGWNEFWSLVATNAQNWWDDVTTGWTEFWDGVASAFDTLKASLSQAWNSFWSGLADGVASIWDGIVSTVKGAVNSLIGFVNGMISAIVGGLNGAIDVLNSLSIDTPDWLPFGMGGQHLGFNISHITAPQIPLLANGGVIKQPTLAMMGEYAGARNDPEIAAPQSAIQQAVAAANGDVVDAILTVAQQIIEAIRESGGDVVIDDTAIGQAVQRYNRRQAIISGGVL